MAYWPHSLSPYEKQPMNNVADTFKRTMRRLLVKKRTVFMANAKSASLRALPLPDGYAFYVNPTIPSDSATFTSMAEYVNPELLKARLANPAATLFLITEVESERVAGFYWAAINRQQGRQELWHDNFPIPYGFALLFNAVVVPEHRRRGLYQALIMGAQHHLLGEVGLPAIYTIVENQNSPSLRANTRFGGQVVATNILVKLLGVNVFSIFRQHPTGQVTVHYVFRNTKSHRF